MTNARNLVMESSTKNQIILWFSQEVNILKEYVSLLERTEMGTKLPVLAIQHLCLR